MLRLIILVSLTSLTFPLLGQKNYLNAREVPEKTRKYFDLGMEMLYGKRPEQAIRYFDKALAQEANFIDAQIFKSGALTQIGDLLAAEEGFEAVLNLDSNYDPVVFYDVGLVEYKLEKYQEAIDHLQGYLNTKPKEGRRKTAAMEFLNRAQLMLDSQNNPFTFKPKNIGIGVNDRNSQYLPALTADEETLIYSALIGVGYTHEDFFISHKKDGKWQRGVPITAVNTPRNEAAHAISGDGKLLIFTACDRKDGIGRCDLFYSENICGEWSPVKVMEQPISGRAWDSQPSLSADGNSLYFSSDREGSIGGKDLWVAQRKLDGTWEVPKNLGPNINTEKDEQTPFIHPDGETLYFLSKGHYGFGEDDIFISRKQSDGTWSIPQNFGYPINSEKSEGPLSVTLDGKKAYFSSSRTDFEGAQGKMDIYTFEMPERFRPQPVTYVKAIVSDEITSAKLGAKVEFINLITGKVHVISETDCNGEFLVTLPSGKNYMLNISKEGYLFHSENFELTDKGGYTDPFNLDVKLVPISLSEATEIQSTNSTPIILKNVFFETGSADLKSESLLELNRLKELLESNPNLNIQINGHTDNVGSEEDNLALSNNRAKAVYDFLIKNQIGSNRLDFKGFGESTPIDSNDTEEGRKNNRRTEFEVIR